MQNHPSIIKGKLFSMPSGRPWQIMIYIPYSFGTPERHYFLQNLCLESGSNVKGSHERKELASLFWQLRRNGFRYVAFYGHKKDPITFLDWVRQKDYTLEIHGELFAFQPRRDYVDFHGNVCEYSAAFHYRIYSRELFQNIIEQLRTVKRHQAWRR